jgi:hypothetical protein
MIDSGELHAIVIGTLLGIAFGLHRLATFCHPRFSLRTALLPPAFQLATGFCLETIEDCCLALYPLTYVS